jgi:hypothetical protein
MIKKQGDGREVLSSKAAGIPDRAIRARKTRLSRVSIPV